MITSHLLLVLVFAVGAGAVDMHKLPPSCGTDGSCLADDAMLLQVAKSSAEEKEKSRTARLVTKLEAMANKVIDGKEKITPATRDALGTIDDEMDSIISNAEQNQQDFQASVDRTKQAIEACGTDATTAQTKDGGINDLAIAVSTARDAHNTCRTSEASLKRDENTKCKDFNDYVGALTMPSCSCSTAETLGVEGFKNCVAEMKTWSATAKTTWADKQSRCDTATSTHGAERSSCNTKQGSLESDFCAYETALHFACSTQDACRTTQKDLREKAHASIAVSESAFKAEYESAKHVKCILKVLNATDEVKRDMLTACTAEQHNTDHLSITYHEVPDAAPCDLTPVANKPCEQAWTDAEFQGKDWQTDAPLNNCVPCPAVAAPTTAPAEVAAAAAAADVPTAAPTTPVPTTQQTFGFAYSSSALKFAGPSKSPDGWTFTDADPSSSACNTWKWSTASNWNRGERGSAWALESKIGLTIDGHVELDWRTDPGAEAMQNYGADSDIILHFCNDVTVRQLIVVPWHQGHPLRADQLQYKDSSGNWQDSGAPGAQKPGNGLYIGTNADAKYWVYGAASSTAVSKYWRVKGMKDTTAHARGCGFQIVTA